jgi:hypothetical protein
LHAFRTVGSGRALFWWLRPFWLAGRWLHSLLHLLLLLLVALLQLLRLLLVTLL